MYDVVIVGGGPAGLSAALILGRCRRPSPLIAQLGCDLSPKGTVPTGGYESTNVPGLYVAGDASRRVQFAVVAAAEGAMAAFALNTELLKAGAV